MTALLPSPTGIQSAPKTGRPLPLIALLGGALAAALPLAACLMVGMVGWYLSDGGLHGAPRDGLRAGAMGWLMGHGSGVVLDGVRITAMPLLVTMAVVFTVWRCALRVGDRVWAHGPDADRIADGERDWTVPMATLFFGGGYAVVVVVSHKLANTASLAASISTPLIWTLGLTALIALPAIATGSGRAAVWSASLPSVVVNAALIARRILLWFGFASIAVTLVGLVLDFGTAINLTSQLGGDATATVVYLGLSVLLLPNAFVLGGSYLLGPGFALGAQTLVSPGAVVLGGLPLFPLLAALPDAGEQPGWLSLILLVPPVVAGIATVMVCRQHPTTSWYEGAASGVMGGVAAGFAVGVVANLAQGSVGPGRMQVVGPFAFEVLLHAVTAFGLGGLLAGLAMTWWHRRS